MAIATGGFEISMSCLMRRAGLSVVNKVAWSTFVNRTAGASKMSLREALGYLGQLTTLYTLSSRRARHAIEYPDRVPPAS